MDSTVLRLIWALVVVFTGFAPGVIVYVVAVIIMPIKPTPVVEAGPTGV